MSNKTNKINEIIEGHLKQLTQIVDREIYGGNDSKLKRINKVDTAAMIH